MKKIMARLGAPLAAWEAVLPGVALPLLALWLGGSDWADRGLAAAANAAPLATLALLTLIGGRRIGAVQATATLVFGAVALGWLAEGTGWDFGVLPTLAEHVALFLPLVASACAVALFTVIALGMRIVTGTSTLARS